MIRKGLRFVTFGALAVVVLGLGYSAWREAFRPHRLFFTVPDGEGLFGVWCRDDFPDVVEIDGRVARVRIPLDGLLRTRQLDCMGDWHREYFEDREGRSIEDVHGMGSQVSSEWPGVLYLWYRGKQRDAEFAELGRLAFTRKHGMER